MTTMMASKDISQTLTDNDFPTGMSHQRNHPKIVRLGQLILELADEYDEAAQTTEERQFCGRRMRSKSELLTLVFNEIVPKIGNYKVRCRDGVTWEINQEFSDTKLRKRVSNSFNNFLKTRAKNGLAQAKRAARGTNYVGMLNQVKAVPNQSGMSVPNQGEDSASRQKVEETQGLMNVSQPQQNDVGTRVLPESTMDQSRTTDSTSSSRNGSSEADVTIRAWMTKKLSNTSLSVSTGSNFSSWLEELVSIAPSPDVVMTSLSSGTLTNNFIGPTSSGTFTGILSVRAEQQASLQDQDLFSASAQGVNSAFSSGSSFMERISVVLGCYSWDTPMSSLTEEGILFFMDIVPEVMRIRGGGAMKSTTGEITLSNVTEIVVRNHSREIQTVHGSRPTAANASVRNLLAKMVSGSQQAPALRRSLEDLLDEFETGFSSMAEIQEADRVFKIILKVMQECIEDSKLQIYGCTMLAILARQSQHNQTAIANIGGVTAILNAMNRHANSSETQLCACNALAVLSRQNQSNQTAIVDAGGVAAILNVMHRHFDSSNAQFHACSALAALSDDNQANQTAISHAGGILSVLKAMQRYTDNKEMQVCGCSMLYRVARKHRSNQKAVLDAGGIAVLVNVMERYLTSSEDVVRNCSSAFAVLCDGRRWSQQKLAQIRCNEVVATAMQLYASNEEVQSACGILLTRLSDASPTNQSAICAAGGITIISSSMQEYPDIEEIQTNGCKALSSLFREKQLDQFEISDSGCMLAVLNAMENYSSVEVIQVHGCNALGKIYQSIPGAQILIVDSGGTTLVVALIVLKAMKDNDNNESIQFAGFEILSALSCADDFYQTAICDVESIAIVLNVMQKYPDEVQIQFGGCLIISNSFRKRLSSVLEVFRCAGGITTVLKSMKTYVHMEDIHILCFRILLTLCRSSNDEYQHAICDAGGIAIVLNVMQQYPNHGEIQATSCEMLMCLSFTRQSSLLELRKCRGEIILLHAMRCFIDIESIQVTRCIILSILCKPDLVYQARIHDVGGVAVISNAMEKYPDNATIQECGQMMLNSLLIWPMLSWKDRPINYQSRLI